MKVLLLDTNHERIKEGLTQLNFEFDEDYHSTKQEIEDRIHLYDGIVIRSRFKIDQSFLEKAKNLKFIGRVGAGLENIDLNYAEQQNIHLIAAPEGNRNAVGEQALGMILALFNRLCIVNREVREGIWLREENRGIELEGKTVGIIGYGNMGKAFAKKLKGFDCEVIFYDILPNLEDQNAKKVSLVELMERTDILSLHTPQTELTKKMVNKNFIESFSKSFYLINTARGSAVVTEDLVEGLKSGKVLGACLDVLEYEKSSFENMFSEKNGLPAPFQFLIESDKVLLSPHIAGWTHESKYKLADVIIKKLEYWLNNSLQNN
ncbi:2-hydroxyacid dehydrogenase [Namhaeicola litoreus]|uniref:2-hydroxyacid dehydrogenase n=1 Tax=Namhaeicola litoreus TaxID=1052145 RepID=A0ABW3XWT3_9FLAO